MPVVDSDDASLHYRSTGEGRTLVFVHGGWVSSRMWSPQVERFADEFQIVTVDIRGHGETDSDHRRFSVDLFASDLDEVLDEVDADDPVLCGLSLGGLIVQRHAATYDRAESLVLAGTTRTVPPIPMTKLQKLTFAPKPVMHSVIRTMGVRAYYEWLLASIRAIEGHEWVALDPENRAYVREEIDRFSTEEYIGVFDALYDYQPTDLSDVDLPALLVHGDHESSTVVHQNRKLAAELDASRVVVPDAGHLANLDNPAAFNEALEGFLAA